MKKNLLFVMLMAFIFSFEGMSQCGLVSLIGEFNDWAGDHYMDRDPMDVNSFSTILVLTDADDTSDPPDGIVELKFRENADWTNNWGAADFPAGTATVGGDNIPVPVGSYLVEFNCETLEYTFTATCGVIGMIGEFNDWAGDHFMMRDPMNIDMWTTTISFTEADDTSDPPDGIIEMKFRENEDWINNWGSADFPSGTGINGGDNIPAPIGNYLVEFNCSTGEYTFTATCGEVSIIGELNDWAGDYAMERSMEDPDMWSVVLSLNEDSDTSDPPDGIVELKFRENAGWDVNWGSADFPSGTGTIGGDNIPVPLDETGITTDYLVTFNCATGEYNFEATCGAISMIGAFVDWNGDVPMNRDADDPDVWTLSRSWGTDSEVKFRENADWTANWGSADWPSGTGEDNGANIPLVAGKYDVTFNCADFAYDFTVNNDICGEIGMIGDFNEWGGTDPAIPTDVYLVRDAMYPTLFSLTYNFSSTTGLLFRVDADPVATNWYGGTFPMGQAVMDPSQILNVPGGTYKITYNCLANTFSFEQLGNSIIAPKVFAIEVDGILNEADWDISHPVAKVVEGVVTEDLNEVFWGAAYTDEYLYVGMDILDGILMPNEEGHLFVDGDKSGGPYDEHDVHIKFSGAGIEVIQGPAGLIPMLGFVPSAVGYSSEVGIAWADLGITPVEGEGIRIDVMVGDDDNGAAVDYYLAWNGGMQNLESTSSFGDMVFGALSCGCISLYSETTGDVVLRNPTDMPSSYVGTYEIDADYNMVFRKDMQATVHWGAGDFPIGVAELAGAEIPATPGRYRVEFDCLSGEYSFTDEPAGDGSAYAQFTDAPVTIDGNLAEYSLDYGSEIMATTTGPENNNTVVWGALWDMTSFYVGVSVTDDVVEGAGNPWDNDAIEFYIDGNHDQDGTYDADFDTQLILDFAGQSVLWIKADGVPITDYESNWTATAAGYDVEMRIAWSNIDFYPGKNRSIGWSLANNDSDNGLGRDYQTTWFGTENNWSNTGDLGDLQLAGGPYFGIHDVVYYNAQFVLYPNPSNGATYLRTTGDIFDGQVEIFVTDLSGRTVVSQTERLFGSNDVVTLRTNDLQTGLYLINIMGADGKKAVKKLIIR